MKRPQNCHNWPAWKPEEYRQIWACEVCGVFWMWGGDHWEPLLVRYTPN